MCHCDNQSVEDVVGGGYGRDNCLALMLRCLFFLEAKFDCSLSAMHVPGIQNEAADSMISHIIISFILIHRHSHSHPRSQRT